MAVSPSRARRSGADAEPESLKDAFEQALDEARMVLPGIQALLGFQLIAVLSPRFDTVFGPTEQLLHLAAIVLVTGAVALVMAPAAYHRHTDKLEVTAAQLRLTSQLVGIAMGPLALGLAIDIYLVARAITDSVAASLAIGGFVLALTAGLWFVMPRLRRR
jgi:hypothetical protein